MNELERNSCKSGIHLVDIIQPIYFVSLNTAQFCTVLAKMINETVRRFSRDQEERRKGNPDAYIDPTRVDYQLTLAKVRKEPEILHNLAVFQNEFGGVDHQVRLLLSSLLLTLDGLHVRSSHQASVVAKIDSQSNNGARSIVSSILNRIEKFLGLEAKEAGSKADRYSQQSKWYQNPSQSNAWNQGHQLAEENRSEITKRHEKLRAQLKEAAERLHRSQDCKKLLQGAIMAFASTCTHLPSLRFFLDWLLETKNLIHLPNLSQYLSQVVAAFAKERSLTAEDAQTLVARMPNEYLEFKLNLIKALILQTPSSKTDPEYSLRFRIDDRLDFADQGLKLFQSAQIKTGLPARTLDEGKVFLEENVRRLRFQRACLRVTYLHLVPRLIELNRDCAAHYQLCNVEASEVDPIGLLACVDEWVHRTDVYDWKELYSILNQLTFSALEYTSIRTELIDRFHLRDLLAIYNLKEPSLALSPRNFQKEVVSAIEAFASPATDPCSRPSILRSYAETVWPLGFIAYWRGLFLELGEDIDQLELPAIIQGVEETCERRAIAEGKDHLDIDEQLQPIFSEHNLKLDYYWFPFIILERRLLDIWRLMEFYCQAADLESHPSAPSTDIRIGAALRIVHSLISLSVHLSKFGPQNPSLASSFIQQTSRSQLLTSQMNVTGEARIRQTATVVAKVCAAVDRLLTALDHRASKAHHRAKISFARDRREKMGAKIDGMDLQRSLRSVEFGR